MWIYVKGFCRYIYWSTYYFSFLDNTGQFFLEIMLLGKKFLLKYFLGLWFHMDWCCTILLWKGAAVWVSTLVEIVVLQNSFRQQVDDAFRKHFRAFILSLAFFSNPVLKS